ncbi:uncharacterized protein YALI1_A19798g [Yarrowia lipolytica]|uniref:Uncharacterized protein n=1 Tax=Yarrowia lipolytica TaxID=4952 RepID=A0A1D8N5F3_YARLL|nr:hypothetical protein YALI1_A19798g [Yarrowia lipolytica]
MKSPVPNDHSDTNNISLQLSSCSNMWTCIFLCTCLAADMRNADLFVYLLWSIPLFSTIITMQFDPKLPTPQLAATPQTNIYIFPTHRDNRVPVIRVFIYVHQTYMV